MSKKDEIKLITIQDAAKQLGISISEFLKYIKDNYIERKSKTKKIPVAKEMLTIGVCVGERKYCRLTKDNLQQFINHKDGNIEVRHKDAYTHWYEASQQRATLGVRAFSPIDTSSVSIEGLCISENDFTQFKKLLTKKGIFLFFLIVIQMR
jgi:hypothetical protein